MTSFKGLSGGDSAFFWN